MLRLAIFCFSKRILLSLCDCKACQSMPCLIFGRVLRLQRIVSARNVVHSPRSVLIKSDHFQLSNAFNDVFNALYRYRTQIPLQLAQCLHALADLSDRIFDSSTSRPLRAFCVMAAALCSGKFAFSNISNIAMSFRIIAGIDLMLGASES